MSARSSPSRTLIWAVALLLAAVFVLSVWHLRSNVSQPGSQAELDALRKPHEIAWPPLEIEKQNDAYYARGTGIDDRKEHCGKEVTNLVVVHMNHSFAQDVLIQLADDGRLRRVEHAPAFVPANGGAFRDGDALVLNPAMAAIVMRSRNSQLPWAARRWIWRSIDLSGLLQLPPSGGPGGAVDGSSLSVMVCRNGLHYRFHRSLNGFIPEPPLQALVATLEHYAPDLDDAY